MALNYTLKLSKEHLLVLQRACELYMRIQMGQLTFITEMFAGDPQVDTAELYDVLSELMSRSRARGLANVRSAKGDAAYDLMQVIRHKLSWDRHPEGGMTVNFDTPMQTSQMEMAEIYRNTDVLK